MLIEIYLFLQYFLLIKLLGEVGRGEMLFVYFDLISIRNFE